MLSLILSVALTQPAALPAPAFAAPARELPAPKFAAPTTVIKVPASAAAYVLPTPKWKLGAGCQCAECTCNNCGCGLAIQPAQAPTPTPFVGGSGPFLGPDGRWYLPAAPVPAPVAYPQPYLQYQASPAWLQAECPGGMCPRR